MAEQLLQKVTLADIAYSNLTVFSEYGWKDAADHVPNATMHNEWFSILQPPTRPLRLHIEAPREHAKTTNISVKYPLWRLGRNHDLRILLISKSASLATNILREIKQNIEENPRIKEVFPELEPKTPWSDIEIQVKRTGILKDPSVTGVGLHGSLTGKRADIIILDDPFDEQEVSSSLQRQKVENWIEKVALPVLTPDGEIIAVGTRWHYDDYWGKLLEKTDHNGNPLYKCLIYRAILNPEEQDPAKWNTLWPEKWDWKRLLSRKNEMGTLRFNCLYQNDPSGYEGVLFNPAHLHFYDPKVALLERLKDLDIFVGVDPNIKEDPKADNTALVTIAVDRNRKEIFVLGMFAKPMEFTGQLRAIRQHALRLQPEGFPEGSERPPQKIGVESVAYQRTLMRTAYMNGLPVVEVHHTKTNKLQRILALQPHFESGRIKFPSKGGMKEGKKPIWWDEFYQEYVTFPRGRRDDRMDALEIAIDVADIMTRGSSMAFGPGGDDDYRWIL